MLLPPISARRAILALTIAALPLPASAQVLGDADVVAELLIDYGLRVERRTDDYGDPVIDSRIDGTRFNVSFYDCDPGPCGSIQFSAGFDMNDPVSPRVINEWNRDHRFGKAFLDKEGDPFLQLDVMMSGDGIGKRNFDEILSMWQDALSEFRTTIDF